MSWLNTLLSKPRMGSSKAGLPANSHLSGTKSGATQALSLQGFDESGVYTPPLAFQPAGTDRSIARIGIGTAWREPLEPEAACWLIKRAFDDGIRLVDTGDCYGPSDDSDATGFSENCIRQALTDQQRSELYLITKAGFVRCGPKRKTTVNNRPEYLRWACDQSRARLGIDCLPVFMLHSIDPAMPLAETLGVFLDLQEQGKIGGIGLSMPDLTTLKRAVELAPITAVQIAFDPCSPPPRQYVEFCEQHQILITVAKPFGRREYLADPLEIEGHGLVPKDLRARGLLLNLMAASPLVAPLPCTRDRRHQIQNGMLASGATEVSQLFAAEMSKPAPPIRELEFEGGEASQAVDLNRHGCAALKQVLSVETLDAMSVAFDSAYDEVDRCVEEERSPQHLAHLLARSDRGSLPLIHYPSISEMLAKLLVASPIPDLIKRCWGVDEIVLGLGFSHMRRVDPLKLMQRSYAPMHQDGEFLESMTFNVCIPLSGYGGEFPGMDMYPSVGRLLDQTELKDLESSAEKLWLPEVVKGDALIFNGLIPHRRSFHVAHKPRKNIEARIFPKHFALPSYHPLVTL